MGSWIIKKSVENAPKTASEACCTITPIQCQPSGIVPAFVGFCLTLSMADGNMNILEAWLEDSVLTYGVLK